MLWNETNTNIEHSVPIFVFNLFLLIPGSCVVDIYIVLLTIHAFWVVQTYHVQSVVSFDFIFSLIFFRHFGITLNWIFCTRMNALNAERAKFNVLAHAQCEWERPISQLELQLIIQCIFRWLCNALHIKRLTKPPNYAFACIFLGENAARTARTLVPKRHRIEIEKRNRINKLQ